MTNQPVPITITDPTGLYPFTFIDKPTTEYVSVEKAMYDLTVERIRQLAEENETLKIKAKSYDLLIETIMSLEHHANKKDMKVEALLDYAAKYQDAKQDVEALESIVSNLDRELGRAEGDRRVLALETHQWRETSGKFPWRSDALDEARKRTNESGALERGLKEE